MSSVQDRQHDYMPGAGEGALREAPPVIAPGHTFESINDKISSPILTKRTPIGWFFGFAIAFAFLMLMNVTIGKLLMEGIGIWGNNIPVGWAFDIINFVWWIGIGHAGTLISAILLLFRQQWRTSINRFAEAMTLFAVACAGMYPVIHTGRPWLAYWLLPYPNTMGMWPNFRSPLIWDVFAVSTYATVSLLFWFVGLIPDLATLRDRSENSVGRTIYGLLAMGWRGSAQHWQRYETAYLLLAALSTPLVLSVHTIVSFDFAVGQVPGWHATVFPPYFVAGAIFSGFAMVFTLLIPARHLFNLKHIIKAEHVEAACKIMLGTGMMVGLAYATEFFISWYSGNLYEKFAFANRAFGPFWWAYFAMVSCNVLVPQAFWFKKVRRSPMIIFALCILINVGMWFERFVIIATSLARSFLPAQWSYYSPTRYDVGLFVGTLGLFFTLFLLFFRFAPVIAISEVKGAMPEAHAGKKHQP